MARLKASSLIETLVALVIVIVALSAALTAYLHLASAENQQGHLPLVKSDLVENQKVDKLGKDLTSEVRVVVEEIQIADSDSMAVEFLIYSHDED